MSTSQAQLARMLTLVPYLRSRDGVPVKQVAADFGVSTRQIVKDLNVLWFCGLPQAVTGEMIDIDMDALQSDGVVHLENAEFLDRPLRLTSQEAISLIVALRTLRAAATPRQSEVIDSVSAKLETVVGERGRAPVDVHVEQVDPAVQEVLNDGVQQHRRVAIDYASASHDEHTHRVIEPLRIFASQGRLFCEAWCLRADDLRTFRLDRVLSADLTEEAFEERRIAADDRSDGLFSVGEGSASAVLDLTQQAFWVTEYYETEDLGSPADGVRRVRLYGSDEDWLKRLVLGQGGAATVVEPASLARSVVSDARSALAAYSG